MFFSIIISETSREVPILLWFFLIFHPRKLFPIKDGPPRDYIYTTNGNGNSLFVNNLAPKRQVWLNVGIYVYREDAMTSFFNKTRVLFLISLVLTFLLSSFWVFQPLSKEIKKRQLVEFTLLAETKIHAFHELVDRHGQSIRSLSSRTMIKNA